MLVNLYVGGGSGSKLARSLRVGTGPDFTTENAEAAIARFFELYADVMPSKERLVCGVSVPGLVEDGQLVLIPDIKGLEGWVPKESPSLSRRCATVTTANDIEAAAAALPERWRGDGMTAVVLVVGTGIGCFYVDRGRPVLGAKGWTGEFGLSPIPEEGGGLTTWDRVLSGRAIVNRVNEKLGLALSAEDLADSTQPPVVAARQTEVLRAARYLGMAIATHVNMLNPDVVFMGGGAFRWPDYAQTAVTTARELAIANTMELCTLEVAHDPAHLPALGASFLCRRE